MYAVWIVARMAFASRGAVVATLVGPETCAISYHAIPGVVNMDSARTERVSVRRAGTEGIAHYVSTTYSVVN